MTRYNVHLYREMRLLFRGIEADTPETAAALAREMPTDDADDLEDCNGEDLAALIDVVGDENYVHSRTLEFEGERQRKAAGPPLAALVAARLALNTAPRIRVGDTDSYKIAARIEKAIAEVMSAGVTPTPAEVDAHAELAGRRQIAEVWNTLDVRTVRPDLTDDQAWRVLQAVHRHYDPAVGITWDVLWGRASAMFGHTPTAETEA